MTTWRARTSHFGWAILPLRLFLGVTLIYAGLQKFFDPNYLSSTSPNGVQSQMAASAVASPISGIVSQAAEHATLFGLTIALGELLVGLGVVLGIWVRIAALGGFLLSLSFFLTVSWGISPYYLGSDIIFMFAFLPLIIGGDGGVLSVEAAIRRAARRRLSPAESVPADESAEVSAKVGRRVLVQTGAVAVIVGVGAVVLGGIGRMVAGNSSSALASGEPSSGPSADTSPAQPAVSATGAPAGGTSIGASTELPVGGSLAFTDGAGNPGFALQPKAGAYLAYSAVCTHEGCTVGYDQGANQFACPCHGARFDGASGDVLRGPARDPLQKYTVTEWGGTLYVV